MYNLRRYIFRENIAQEYVRDFNKYMIDTIYGDNILIGSEIENDYKDIPPEGE